MVAFMFSVFMVTALYKSHLSKSGKVSLQLLLGIHNMVSFTEGHFTQVVSRQVVT